jgi:hypothetical protein
VCQAHQRLAQRVDRNRALHQYGRQTREGLAVAADVERACGHGRVRTLGHGVERLDVECVPLECGREREREVVIAAQPEQGPRDRGVLVLQGVRELVDQQLVGLDALGLRPRFRQEQRAAQARVEAECRAAAELEECWQQIEARRRQPQRLELTPGQAKLLGAEDRPELLLDLMRERGPGETALLDRALPGQTRGPGSSLLELARAGALVHTQLTGRSRASQRQERGKQQVG